jgi:primosomal protein N' (replication factor Y)
MHYYEVFIADGRYHGDTPLVYSHMDELAALSIVTVPLKQRIVSGFVIGKTQKPSFNVRPIKALMSDRSLPAHCLNLASWLQEYYVCTKGDALRQFAPNKTTVRRRKVNELANEPTNPKDLVLSLNAPLTNDQSNALNQIRKKTCTTILLHGDTGTGKTRVYLELAKETLANNQSVLMLTPEIALTSQLALAARKFLGKSVFVIHSGLSVADRKKIWFDILESNEPLVVIGPRSALFAPINRPGLVIVDEAHEPAYKQEQSPRYHAPRVASQLGYFAKAKVIFGTATPSISDYYLAQAHDAIVRMTQPAIENQQMPKVDYEVIDLRDKNIPMSDVGLTKKFTYKISKTLQEKKQVMVYLNKRGSARVVLCNSCGWRLSCPNCDVSLIYHGDEHKVRCHICGYQNPPPLVCPECSNGDIVYKGHGTKALTDWLSASFPDHTVKRFDSDNTLDEQVNELYSDLHSGKINMLIGTQLLAKGLDLPKLGMVGIVAAESSLALPDYTAEERTFQLLYQAMGRVGRGHGAGRVVVQSYDPDSVVIKSATSRNWKNFYDHCLEQRQKYRFPPYSYLLKITCRRSTLKGAETAARRLKVELQSYNLPVEIIGPTPSFYSRRQSYYYWQLVVKSKQRRHLVALAKTVPANWMVDLDPIDLL